MQVIWIKKEQEPTVFTKTFLILLYNERIRAGKYITLDSSYHDSSTDSIRIVTEVKVGKLYESYALPFVFVTKKIGKVDHELFDQIIEFVYLAKELGDFEELLKQLIPFRHDSNESDHLEEARVFIDSADNNSSSEPRENTNHTNLKVVDHTPNKIDTDVWRFVNNPLKNENSLPQGIEKLCIYKTQTGKQFSNLKDAINQTALDKIQDLFEIFNERHKETENVVADFILSHKQFILDFYSTYDK